MVFRMNSVVTVWRPRPQHTDCRQSRPKPARQYLSNVMDKRPSTWCRCLCRGLPCCFGQCLDQYSNHRWDLGELHWSGGDAHTVAPVTEYDQLLGGVPGDTQVTTSVPPVRYLEPRGFAAHMCSMYHRDAIVDEHGPQSARGFRLGDHQLKEAHRREFIP
jgi:hypothetical protein